jgi:hypothetical protein
MQMRMRETRKRRPRFPLKDAGDLDSKIKRSSVFR